MTVAKAGLLPAVQSSFAARGGKPAFLTVLSMAAYIAMTVQALHPFSPISRLDSKETYVTRTDLYVKTK